MARASGFDLGRADATGTVTAPQPAHATETLSKHVLVVAKSPWSGSGLLVGCEKDLGGHLKAFDAPQG